MSAPSSPGGVSIVEASRSHDIATSASRRPGWSDGAVLFGLGKEMVVLQLDFEMFHVEYKYLLEFSKR